MSLDSANCRSRDRAVEQAAARLGTKPAALDGEVFGVSTDGITSDQLKGQELRDYAGNLIWMAVETFKCLNEMH